MASEHLRLMQRSGFLSQEKEGTTAYDENDAALELILQEWTSSRSYGQRVGNLRTGRGPVLEGSETMLNREHTVFDDDDVDKLFAGAEVDWLFYDLSRDKARDKRRGETTN